MRHSAIPLGQEDTEEGFDIYHRGKLILLLATNDANNSMASYAKRMTVSVGLRPDSLEKASPLLPRLQSDILRGRFVTVNMELSASLVRIVDIHPRSRSTGAKVSRVGLASMYADLFTLRLDKSCLLSFAGALPQNWLCCSASIAT